jgi:hypothetical protein
VAYYIQVFKLIIIPSLLLMSDKYISSTTVNGMYFNKSCIQQLFVNPLHLLLEEFQLSEVETSIFTYNIEVSGMSI